MGDPVPTQITRLKIEGFRSIESIDITEIPEIVVLHGPNGAGKSNIFDAIALVFRLARGEQLPQHERSATRLRYQDAVTALGLRREDFFDYDERFGLHRAMIRVEFQIGHRTSRDAVGEQGVLELHLDDDGSGIKYWFGELPQMPDGYSDETARYLTLLNQPDPPEKGFIREALDRIGRMQEAFSVVGRRRGRRIVSSGNAVRSVQREKMSAGYVDDGGQASGLQRQIHLAFTSPDRRVRAQARSLSEHLAKLGVLGSRVEIIPVNNPALGELEVLIGSDRRSDFPLSRLGTGEQQLVALLAEIVLPDCPIVLLEEPEAHLHSSSMVRLGSFLEKSFQPGMPGLVDQLWIATHHHLFALSDKYLDVRREDGRTLVEWCPKAKAAAHYYEPGPIWDALKSLARSGLEKESIMFRLGDGSPVTASALLASLEEEGDLARKFALQITELMVLKMKEKAQGKGTGE